MYKITLVVVGLNINGGNVSYTDLRLPCSETYDRPFLPVKRTVGEFCRLSCEFWHGGRENRLVFWILRTTVYVEFVARHPDVEMNVTYPSFVCACTSSKSHSFRVNRRITIDYYSVIQLRWQRKREKEQCKSKLRKRQCGHVWGVWLTGLDRIWNE